MSIDIDVLPLGAPSTWRAVVARWRAALGDDARRLLGPRPTLRRLGTHAEVGPDGPLVPPLLTYFDLPVRNSLSLTALANRDVQVVERSWLEDYGRNLSRARKSDIAERWTSTGYTLGLSTGMGRSVDEPRLLITVAVALAEATDGLVTVMNDGVSTRGVGVYTPDEFRTARWHGRAPPSGP